MAAKTSSPFRKFIDEEVWKTPLNSLPKSKAFIYRQIRIWLITVSEYQRDKCAEKASALTYFSILSIVPVIALAFGIATAFGLEDYFRGELENYFAGQQEVLEYMLTFSESMLTNASGGLISGISSLFLIFTVAKLFNNIELSFNSIWQTPKGRTFQRKVSDYMSVIFLGPIILIVSSTSTVFITTQVENLTASMEFLGGFRHFIMLSIQLIPYTLIWLLLFLIYIVFPNTKVNIKPALVAGILAGTIYQATQWAYINFQIGVSNYSAIYGSFAALPLFLIWLQLSWMITLFGAEYAFAAQNVGTWSYKNDSLQISNKAKKKVAVMIVHAISIRFNQEDRPTTFEELTQSLKIPQWLLKSVCIDLLSSGVMVKVSNDTEAEDHYLPGIDLSKLSIISVLNRMDMAGGNVFEIPLDSSIDKNIDEIFAQFDELLQKSTANKPILEI